MFASTLSIPARSSSAASTAIQSAILNFRIIQFGICFFIKNIENNKEYIAKPYNIYIFPSEKQNNNKFDFYVESIIFNKNHGCDFNKWISKGVPYLNDDNLNKLLERTINGDINKYNPNISSIQVVKKGKVRRAKLYFLRGRTKKYNIKERANKDALIQTD